MGHEEDSLPPPSPSPSPEKSNLPMLFYGLAVVGAATILLAMYNLVIIKCCSSRHNRSDRMNNDRFTNGSANQSFENSSTNLVWSFKYKKKGSENQEGEEKHNGDYYECAVCLSLFEDGEEVRQLPRCNHCFHAQCIDLWLNSHFDCPLCRTRVEHRDHSFTRVGLMESGTPV